MLNPELYNLLSRRYGKVKISNENIPMSYSLLRDDDGKVRGIEKPISGEEYCVCCPVCGDKRFRLYFNHRFGTMEAESGIPFNDIIRLAHCFNEQCDLSREVELLKPYAGRHMPIVKAQPSEAQSIRKVPKPGSCARLDILKEDHPAIQFVLGRNFDPDELAKKYGVSYCYSSTLRFARNRLIIPILEREKIVGWQSRYLGDVPKQADIPKSGASGCVSDIIGTGIGFIVKVDKHEYYMPKGSMPTVKIGESVSAGSALAVPVPKYWTAPGTPRNTVLYNLDRARRYPYVIVVEGPLDAIRIGGPVIATLGTSVTALQQRRIAGIWQNKNIILMFDPEAADTTEKVKAFLSKYMMESNLLSITLPAGKDPADFSRDEIWNIIISYATDKGLALVK